MIGCSVSSFVSLSIIFTVVFGLILMLFSFSIWCMWYAISASV